MQEKQGLKDIYRFYKQTAKKPVDFNTFKRVWETFIDEVIQGVILEGRDFNMPSLGSLGIRKQKIVVGLTEDGEIDRRNLRPDWDATKKLWASNPEAKKNKQLVYHLNKHFNGYNAKWFWDKRTCSVTNNTAYSLTMSRANKRLLSTIIKDEETQVDYHEQKPKVRSREHSNQYE